MLIATKKLIFFIYLDLVNRSNQHSVTKFPATHIVSINNVLDFVDGIIQVNTTDIPVKNTSDINVIMR